MLANIVGFQLSTYVLKPFFHFSENTPLAMDEERPWTVLHEFEEDLTESDYATIQKDQTGE